MRKERRQERQKRRSIPIQPVLFLRKRQLYFYLAGLLALLNFDRLPIFYRQWQLDQEPVQGCTGKNYSYGDSAGFTLASLLITATIDVAGEPDNRCKIRPISQGGQIIVSTPVDNPQETLG